MTSKSKTQSAEGAMVEYVTAMIGGQLFGLPISRVQDVFMPERVTRVPLSSMVSPAAIERGRQAGFHDYVAKFDRPGLIAALKEQTATAAGASELSRAAA